MNDTPILKVTSAGIKTTDKEWEFDYVVCATGFDAITGGVWPVDLAIRVICSLSHSRHFADERGRTRRQKAKGRVEGRGQDLYGPLCLRVSQYVSHVLRSNSSRLNTDRFFTYGPQAPTALCNGPSCAELQGEWIVTLLEYMKEKELRSVDATPESAKAWAEGISTIANMSLLPTTKSVRTCIPKQSA
jgi:hypothetical protein